MVPANIQPRHAIPDGHGHANPAQRAGETGDIGRGWHLPQSHWRTALANDPAFEHRNLIGQFPAIFGVVADEHGGDAGGAHAFAQFLTQQFPAFQIQA